MLMVGAPDIEFIGAAGAGAETVSVPTHRTGDLIIVQAVDGGLATITVPGDFTEVETGTWSRCGYKFAASASETSGTWTNAGDLSVVVYRNVRAIGDTATSVSFGGVVTFPALTLQNSSGRSWVVGALGFISTLSGDQADAPTGMTSRNTSGGTGELSAIHDTNGGVTSWSAQTLDNGSYRAFTIELLPI